MGILLAIILGVASILNLMYGQNQPIQYLLTVLSVICLIIYRGKRTKRVHYNGYGQNYFTIGFTICILSFVGTVGILIGFLFHLA